MLSFYLVDILINEHKNNAVSTLKVILVLVWRCVTPRLRKISGSATGFIHEAVLEIRVW